MRRLVLVLRYLALVAVVLGLAGCVAEPAERGSSGVELVDLGYELDGVVSERRWRSAPAGCDGRIGDGDRVARVALAQNAPSLGVVLDDRGDVLCVDTLESIALELLELQGDPSPDPMYPRAIPAR